MRRLMMMAMLVAGCAEDPYVPECGEPSDPLGVSLSTDGATLGESCDRGLPYLGGISVSLATGDVRTGDSGWECTHEHTLRTGDDARPYRADHCVIDWSLRCTIPPRPDLELPGVSLEVDAALSLGWPRDGGVGGITGRGDIRVTEGDYSCTVTDGAVTLFR